MQSVPLATGGFHLMLQANLDTSALQRRYVAVRSLTDALAQPLSAEDQAIQSMADASPTKWHLAHTTWFFERMILAGRRNYRVFDERYDALFNSYYLGLGTPYPRPERGMLSRPSLKDVLDYRAHVDVAMEEAAEDPSVADVIELGLHHEQQHQELILTDILHAFSKNPMAPTYSPAILAFMSAAPKLTWWQFGGGTLLLGHDGSTFAFDNERPAHAVTVAPFRLSSRLVTCSEYQAFMDEGGYDRAEFWLSDGWALAKAGDWRAPLYWRQDGTHFTLHGVRLRDGGAPVTHISFYEAAAYAAWCGKRLPTEFEWEVAARDVPVQGHFLDSGRLLPQAALPGPRQQLFGDAWEWTRSSYDPYPGFRPFGGAAAEYNGKFMVGQLVLRGGSCVTPPGHIRATYRNFFPPAARWQFSGIRLAEDA